MKRFACLSLLLLLFTWQGAGQDKEDPKAIALRNLAATLETFEPAERKRIEDARDADPPAVELITGTRYGQDISDPSLHMFWKYVRNPDGTVEYTDLQLFHEDNEFIRSNDRFHWVLIGRLLIEVYPDDPNFVGVLLIEKIDEKQLSYYYVDEGFPFAEWFLDNEFREEIEFPDVPAGYKEAQE